MHLIIALQDHARIQRDLIEFTTASVLQRQGRGAGAQRLLAIR